MTVALVFVSHSADVARGVVEITRQMAGAVPLEAAGGTDEDGIGTSFDRVEGAVHRALSASDGSGVVVLCDLGSAVLTSETVLDVLDDDERELVRIADAPLVEGAVVAGVAAQQGQDLAAVVAAAEGAWGRAAPADAPAPPEPASDTTAVAGSDAAGDATHDDGTVVRTVRVVNEMGVHARPAAELVKTASTFDADITVGGANAKSILAVVALGSKRGDELEVRASGADAAAAVDAVAGLIESGFGED
ncbi:HPr family phosphocarrier protein [Pseudoclavibacter chungangensis]|uniref:Phosphocarrier protein HPr n=1 Tax=Pseudoclavibacter chungangensis TaxID=587635 RepID=A0A7J5C054_9MICO|nr:dihydroxyacetone kinase phosphoryl donor subunit DhaM [Pseudoclavibacter chungangensis]KAB1660136.1 HPr family phosphocarrier protein [Pseudoclavibacter chungangensis]NYJ66756.1 PTS hybrid protein [Pseudoclavibacter chungangensis]